MTRVCLVGDADRELRYELLSRETSREALSTYDLRAPYENTVGLETVSLGAAVSILNDLDWYVVRFVADAFVLEPSIDDEEWLSRDLATAIRDEDVRPAETGRLLKVYGVERPGTAESPPASGDSSAGDGPAGDQPAEAATPDAEGRDGPDGANEPAEGDDAGPLPRLVEPMYVSRTGETVPEYDIRDVDDTLVVRVTEAEFEA